jgi:transposase
VWRIYIYSTALEGRNVTQQKNVPKRAALARHGTLNHQPQAVQDNLFRTTPFFDPEDLVQVRYEMIRRHQVDKLPITDVVSLFGVTRPTFYKAQKALAEHGLAGLIPQQRGPKTRHKLSAEVLAYIGHLQKERPDITLAQCVEAIGTRFGIAVHQRSLERALASKKKQRR